MTDAHLLAFCVLLLTASCSVAARMMTQMPPYPTDPKDYLSKWDPFVLKPLIGVKDTLSRNNGRQITQDSAGGWFVLVEKDQQAIFLGVSRGEHVAGGDFEMTELAGPSAEAVFRSEGAVYGGSMVLDGDDRLHVTWCEQGALMHASRAVRGLTAAHLRSRQAWGRPQRFAEPPCHPGDVMLDAKGRVVVCYSRQDTVYYQILPDGKAEVAGGVKAGMAPLVVPGAAQPSGDKPRDPAAPVPERPKNPSYPPPRPIEERECREAVMDLGPDGTIHLAFQRDFDIWYAKRTLADKWQPPGRAAWGLAFHPAIIATGDRPLICFQYEGIRKVTLGGNDYLSKREGGGASVAFAVLTDHGWRTDCLAKAEEIVVNRQGIWDARFEGKLLPMVEEMWRPTLFRDRHGVPWALWQNTTRRWAYCARWLGDGFGEVHECRGPFNAPGQPVTAEKLMPPTATDVGLMFSAADRVIFDRLKVPTLSLSESREVLFLDSLEVGETSGVEFVLTQMAKHPANPLISPGPLGSKDDRHVFTGAVRKRGDTYVMSYSYQSWDEAGWQSGGLAIGHDGVHWQKVARLPDNLPPEPDPHTDDPVGRGYFDNPDRADPATRFMRVISFGEGWVKGSKRVQYSPDGDHWTDGPEASVLNAIYEGGGPNLWDPLDIPQRRIKAYGRVFTTNSRSCGMMWTQDLVHWEGAEHFLDPDDPYGKPPGNTSIGPLRGQVFLDACAGKGEDQIYSASVRIVEGLYLCIYWPCSFEHRYDGALAVSRDGFNFTRVKNGGQTLSVGPAGTWDSGMIKMGWPMRDGDILREYYGGSAWHHGVEPYRPTWHIGLATIRVNGWTYYTPTPDEYRGTVTTIPVDAPANTNKVLAVNVEGSRGSKDAVAVEALDAATGKAMKGFAASDCLPLKTDGIAMPVAWKGGRALPTGKAIRLRFHLCGKGVRLYSFRFREVT